MSKRVWTENQKRAIDARGEQILISAAAGSGKTAVLTERVKNILCDEENQCSPSEILVVTFTKAAAAEMRERIGKALKDEIKNHPERKIFLKKQLNLLPTADICTIDSFCSKVVKENFHLASITADFKIIEENEHDVLKSDSVNEVLNELYENEDSSFRSLKEFFTNERNDSELEDIIKKLYEFSTSYPSPEKWLEMVEESFNPENEIESTPFFEATLKYLSMMFEYYHYALEYYLKKTLGEENAESDFSINCAENIKILGELNSACEEKRWDDLVSLIYNKPMVVYPRTKGSKYRSNLRALTTELNKDLNDVREKAIPTSAEFKNDCKILYPIVKKLCEAVNMFSCRLLDKKQEQNTFSFNDILHKCIDLLVEYDGDVPVKSKLAEELTEKYKEILIDEYQDTNEAQNIIFEIISRDKKNFYCVGDVKQSIYRFRLASPELFMSLKDKLPLFDGAINKPTQIILEQNFRSRKGVTECVNFIFSQIMTKACGDIRYDENEYLYHGAKYPEIKDAQSELHIIDALEMNSEELTNYEANYVAEYIKKTIESGALVKAEGSDDKMRPVRYDDFCILARSPKKTVDTYSRALLELGIPSVFENDEISPNSKEVQLLVALIKAVNNPLIDIPLVAIMLSPLFGFVPDELAEIRNINKKSDIYTCVLEYSKSSKKAEQFLRKLDFYRNIASSYPIYDFVKLLIDDTSITEIFLSTDNGEERSQGIKSVLACAENYSDSGRYGLAGFVRYLDSVLENKALQNKGSSSGGGVKIMSIHKSKGLEFPYVILVGCAKGFNLTDSKGALTVSREVGLGVKIRDDERFTRYGTLSSFSSEKMIKLSDKSEELRILYVALTRAKEHLVLICPINSKTGKERIANGVYLKDDNGRMYLPPFSIYKQQSYSEWLCSALVRHESAKEFREYLGMETTEFLDSDFDLKVVVNAADDVTSTEAQDKAVPSRVPFNLNLLEEIKERAEYVYPYDELSTVLAKINASSVEKHIARREFFASKKPKFADEKTTGAKRGTVVHKFLELCDFKKAYDNFENEISRLLSEYKLTEDEISVIDKVDIENFFNEDVGKRLLKSDEVYKEYEFSVLKNAGDFYPELPENLKNEKIVVQGKFDCAFIESDGAVLIDYKTDKITDEETLISIYKGQLDIYKSALEECIEIPVKETYIYSFKLGKFIKI